jgi:hypothetical protein
MLHPYSNQAHQTGIKIPPSSFRFPVPNVEGVVVSGRFQLKKFQSPAACIFINCTLAQVYLCIHYDVICMEIGTS